VETFAAPRELVEHRRYAKDRRRVMADFGLDAIDEPIRDVVDGFARLPWCFTLQSCYGHFVYGDRPEPDSLAPLPAEDVGPVTYRLAYLALCVERNAAGAALLDSLSAVPDLDPEYVQFGSPDWFWDQQPNSYALQVEPRRFREQDTAVLDHVEALRVEAVRDRFFDRLRELLRSGAGVSPPRPG